MSKVGKPKRKWYVRFLLFILKSIAVLAILGIGLYGAVIGFNTYKQYKKNKEFNEHVLLDPLQSLESLESHLRESDEELYGMPIDEAMDLGIDPMVFDTSRNGLSDEDAIKYGADPTKFSTADDGISDMVKILEGYDPSEEIKFDEELELSFDDFGVTLRTNNLNDKYFSYIESYDMPKVVNTFTSAIQPFQVKDYEGVIEVEIPTEQMDDSLTAYQFNFDTLEMKKIKKQKRNENVFSFSLDNTYPVFFLDKENQEAIGDFGTYYFFRVSMPLIEDIVGFNHKVFVFKKTLFPSFKSHEEVIEDDKFGIAEYSSQTMSVVVSFLMDKMYKLLDGLFGQDYSRGSALGKGGIIDYGTIQGSAEDAKLRAMPWLDERLRAEFEDDDNNVENEDQEDEFPPLDIGEHVVADSGFDIRVHAFRFANVSTTITEGGTCAGYARVTEKNFNNEEIPNEYTAKFNTAIGHLGTWVADMPKEVSYDISNHLDELSFLKSKNQFSYTMHDEKTEGLTDGNEETSYDSPLNVEALSNPDQSLFEMLQVYYVEANNNQFKMKNMMYDTKHVNIIDKVIDTIKSGEVVYVSLSGGPGGHGVNAYRVEQDEYNPDKMYMYIYDNNLPYEKVIHHNGGAEQEIRMEIIKEKKKTLFDLNPEFYNHYEFDFAPVKNNDSYRWASENGDKVRFMKNGQAIKK